MCEILHETFNDAVNIINSIMSRPLNVRLFRYLSLEMDSVHETFLFYTEVIWLSKGKILLIRFELCDGVPLSGIFVIHCREV